MASKKNATYTYIDNNGRIKTLRLFGGSSRELDLKFQQFLQTPISKPSPTVSEFVEQTYKPSYFPTLRLTCVESYGQYLKNYILPFMGELPMNEVGIETIQKFINWMATASQHGRKKNLNEPTIRRVLGLVKRIFTIAYEMKVIEDIPVKKALIKINAEKGSHHKPLLDGEIDRIRSLIPEMKNERERLYMRLLAFTGMRLEEILGLRWEDIHLDEYYLEVRRAVTYPSRSKPHIDRTKTEHSERTVLISQVLANILLSASSKQGFVLGGGEPLPYSSKQRTFENAKKALGIVGYDNHDFRTTYATQLSEKGLSNKEVAGLPGHADTRMVDRVYAPARKSGILKQRDIIEGIMCPK